MSGSTVALCVVLSLFAAAPAVAGQRAYFADFGSGSTVPFHALGADGQLLPSGLTPATAGASGLESVAISPDGKRLLTGSKAGSIFNFSVNTASGKLSAGPGAASVTTADYPYGLVITPNGKFAYQAVDSPGGAIYGVTIAPNGSIAATIPGLPKAVPGGARGLAVSSDGKFLYVTEGDDEIGSYAVGANGSLTELADSPLMAITDPFPISLTPDGKYAFVPSRDATPDAFTLVVRADGSLAFLLGGYAPLPADGNPFGTTVTPNGRFYYVVNYNDGTLSGFRINNDGTLAELSGSPYAVRPYLTSVTSDADGSHLYLTNDVSGKVDVLAVADTGVPTPVAGSPFAVGAVGDFQSVALSPDQPPVANLKVSAQTPTTATLDASATIDPEGDAITYYWDFGDGEQTTSDTPKVTHDYAPGDIYFPGVIGYDDRGCGFFFRAAGQTPFCNGGRRAGASVEVNTIKPKLRAKAAKRQRLGKTLKVEVSVPNVPVSVTATANATLKGAKAKTAHYKRAGTDLKPGFEVLKLKLKGKAKKAEKAADRGTASITVIGKGNGYTTTKQLEVKLK